VARNEEESHAAWFESVSTANDEVHVRTRERNLVYGCCVVVTLESAITWHHTRGTVLPDGCVYCP
jgi:hypothetical protein